MLNVPPQLVRQQVARDVMRGREPEPWTLDRLIAIVWRRRNAALATIGLFLLLATLYVVIAPARFTATAALIPDTKRTPPTPAEVPQDALTDPALVESQLETIKSEKIALAVIGKLKLTGDPEFVPPPGLFSNTLSALGLATGSRTEAIKQRIAVANFTRMLKVLRLGRSYVAEISFTSLDPVKAATIANEIAAAYINDQLGARFFSAERSNSWMEQRIADVRRQADETVRAVEMLKAVSNLSIDAAGKSANEREMERLSSRLAEARTETSRARQRLERARAVLVTGDEGRSGWPDEAKLEALSSDGVNRIRAEYRTLAQQEPASLAENRALPQTPGGPPARLAELRGAVWDEVEKVVTSAKSSVEAAEQQEAALTRRISGLEPHLEAERPQLARLREREAEAQAARALYDNLRNRYARVAQFAQQQAALPVTEARVVTEATPPLTKSSPRTTLILFLALCAGGMLGVAAAIGREQFDRSVRSRERLEQELGVRCLGFVPLLSARPGSERNGVTRLLRLASKPGGPSGQDTLLPLRSKQWLTDVASDPLRTIKVAIDGSGRPTRRQVIGITSPERHDGKTTVALGTALLMAQAGGRTLLIDGDLRQPALTGALTPAAKGGLAAVLKSESSLADHVVHHESGLHVLPYVAGSTSAHPADLLSAPAMQSLLDRARGSYDWIVVDLPAVLAHVDVMAAAPLLDAFVLVADWDRTSIDGLARSLAASDVLAERLIGVIVNKSRPAVG